MATATQDHGLLGASVEASPRPTGERHDTYTGVVVVHGIGNERRNETLQEAVDAVSYWFNHVAGLSLRPEGPGRLWLQTELTDNEDPDAPASRAVLELAAPSVIAEVSSSPPSLRLELREVWWAESFGAPSFGSLLQWTRVQFREEAARVLLPLGTARRAQREAAAVPGRDRTQMLSEQAGRAALDL